MNLDSRFVRAAALAAALAVAGCTGGETPKKAEAPKQDSGMPAPTRQALEGPARPALLLTQAWFFRPAGGGIKPGPARLDIWRQASDGKWGFTRLEDPDSNVFHKAVPYDGGILTIGAEKAMLKKWTFTGGEWHDQTLWQRNWGGRFQRLRDMEIGDVDGDGKDEIVIATHDSGVVAVIDPAEGGGEPKVTEFDQKADTFVHEIEIGDIDGDGTLEFFATPSDRNKADASQAGGIVMYRYQDGTYVRTWVEEEHGTHAKEILAHDVDGDGTAELFGVLEAEVDPKDKTKLKKPVEIRKFKLEADGTFSHSVVATINDRQTRFLVAGDFDGDGRTDLVAAAIKTGLYHITQPASGAAADAKWNIKRFDSNSSGFEHTTYGADIDGDGKLELYVAADDQRQLKRYVWENGAFQKTLLGKLEDATLTWNMSSGTF